MQAPVLDSPPVLHIVWNAIRGGTEGQCARVALQFGSHRVAVFRREGFFLDLLERELGPVHEIRIHRMASLHTLQEIRRLQRVIHEGGFAWVHAWDADAAVFGAVAARWAGVPLISSRRDMGEIYTGWKRALMHRADLYAHAVVVNAAAIQQRRVTEGLPANKVVCIPNILDLDEYDRFSRADVGPDLPPGHWIALVARLDAEKDIGTAIRALATLSADHAEWGLVIAGDGIEREALQRTAESAGVSQRVLFLGDTPAIPALLKKCDIGVLTPSANEGLSNTILEYMAAGLPVVATDCGGNKELVSDNKNGFIVPVGDVEGVAQALKQLANDADLRHRMGHAGRQRVEQDHRPEIVAQQFAQLYAGDA